MKLNKDTKGASEQLAPSSKLNRICISCNKSFPREKMIRVLKEHGTNKLIINPNNKTFGRSAYICYNKDCLSIAIKKNRFSKALRIKVSDELLENIKTMIN